MDPNSKRIYARAYTVPRSVEQQLQESKEIVRLVDIGVLEEEYSSEWASLVPSFAIPKKNWTIRVVTDFRKSSNHLIAETSKSPISYSKDWDRWHDPMNWRVYLCFSIGLKYGLLSDQTRCWCSKTMYKCINMVDGKIQIQTLTHGYQDCLVPDVFQNVMSKLVQNMEYVKTYLDDL
jgi:hypothetical protein